MHPHGGEVVIVEPGATQLGIGEIESQRFDEVQFTARGGDHADRVSGVGRDLWLDERDAEHEVRLQRDAEQQVGDRTHQLWRGCVSPAAVDRRCCPLVDHCQGTGRIEVVTKTFTNRRQYLVGVRRARQRCSRAPSLQTRCRRVELGGRVFPVTAVVMS